MRHAAKLYYLVGDPTTAAWLRTLNPTAETLKDTYAADKSRYVSYQEMIDRVLASAREGLDVCVAFYGHPGVFSYPSHELIEQARCEGLRARMLAGISADSCLYADLGVDPGRHGVQSFEASDFLVRRRRPDTYGNLLLWQIGTIGLMHYMDESVCNVEGLRVLVEVLLQDYPSDHEVVVYQASAIPFVSPPQVQRVPLARLAEATVNVLSTLYVPPVEQAPMDLEMLDRLGFPRLRRQPGSVIPEEERAA